MNSLKRVSIVSPASPIQDTSGIEETILELTRLGYEIQFDLGTSQNAEGDGLTKYLTNTLELRIEEVEKAFIDQESDLILCLRGGYGSGTIIDQLNFDKIANNWKPLIGFSDITALHSALQAKIGPHFTTFHGPMLAPLAKLSWTSLSNQKYLSHAFDIITGKTSSLPNHSVEILVEGQAHGRLFGGNLAVLSSLVGTSFIPRYQEKMLLFLEDISEPLYRIDRYLVQLTLSGFFDRVSGLLLGDFSLNTLDQESFRELILDRLAHLDIPIWLNLPIGHIEHNYPLPVGVFAQIDSTNRTLKWKSVC